MNWYYKLVFASIPVGIALGIGAYTFIYAKGYSYLTHNPAACANCHVMNDYYNGWVKSSHKLIAGCNDCHTSAGLIPKYYSKAENGFWHSFAFTTGRFHDPIQIKPRNIEIVEKSCRQCHSEFVSAIDQIYHSKESRISCIKCHNTVGHQ